MQHKTILAQGGIVHYWIARNKNVSDCIVFTHGVTADHTMFEKQVPYFSDNYTIVLWDVPIHGLSRPYIFLITTTCLTSLPLWLLL